MKPVHDFRVHAVIFYIETVKIDQIGDQPAIA